MVPSTIQINAVSHPATFRALLEMEYDHGAVNRLEPEPASFVIPVRFGERLSAIEAEFAKMTGSEMTDFVCGEYDEHRPAHLLECSALLDAVFNGEGEEP